MTSLLARLRPTPWAELSTARKVRRVVGIVSQIGALGMLASAMTSESEVGLRADGSTRKEHKGEEHSGEEHSSDESVSGDPKVKAQRDQAGEEKSAGQDAADVSDAPGNADKADTSSQREAQGGNAAEDTEKAAESTS